MFPYLSLADCELLGSLDLDLTMERWRCWDEVVGFIRTCQRGGGVCIRVTAWGVGTAYWHVDVATVVHNRQLTRETKC